MKKLSAISNLKGFGIILVIFGHINFNPALTGSLNTYIYSFHMPLFFWISGYLMFNKVNQKTFEYLKKTIKSYWIPYTVLFTVSLFATNILIPYLFNRPILTQPFSVFSFFKAYFLAGDYLYEIPLSNFPLWFLPFTMISMIIFFIFLKLTKGKLSYIFVIGLIIGILSIPYQNMFTGARPALLINVLFPALFFIFMGYCYRCIENRIKLSFAILLIIGGVGLLLNYYSKGYAISYMGDYLYLISALCSVTFYYNWFKNIQSSSLSYIGDNSLIFFGIHSLVIAIYYSSRIPNFFLHKWSGVLIYLLDGVSILFITALICIAYIFVKKQLKNIINKYQGNRNNKKMAIM